MPVTININNISLCHKGSNGISTATIPDVCKTPAPPGPPVPIPYPNIAMSMDLMKGTTTVKADGGMMCAIDGSEFMKSTGDEPGVAGGVASSTFIKEATWITFSMDVKFEGKGACRLTDKMFHNHQNTVNMGGVLQAIVALMKVDIDAGCKKLVEYIENLIGEGKTGKTNGIRGLEERFSQQTKGGGLGATGAPNAPFDRGPNLQLNFPSGSNSWMRHDKEIEQQQNNLNEALDKHDEKCKGGPPTPGGAREWAKKTRPSPADWTGPVASAAANATSAGTTLLKGALILGAGIAAVGTVALFLCPFDGPVGEVAGASATTGLWGMAMAL